MSSIPGSASGWRTWGGPFPYCCLGLPICIMGIQVLPIEAQMNQGLLFLPYELPRHSLMVWPRPHVPTSPRKMQAEKGGGCSQPGTPQHVVMRAGGSMAPGRVGLC